MKELVLYAHPAVDVLEAIFIVKNASARLEGMHREALLRRRRHHDLPRRLQVKKVSKSRRSPMNEVLWHITLECGHARWVVGDKPPLRACCRWCDAGKVLLAKKGKKNAKKETRSPGFPD